MNDALNMVWNKEYEFKLIQQIEVHYLQPIDFYVGSESKPFFFEAQQA